MSGEATLASWADTPTRSAIVEFVSTVTDANHEGFIPEALRIAVFDNDGNPWEPPHRRRSTIPTSELDYAQGSEDALAGPPNTVGPVVSMRTDWTEVFADA